MADERKPEEWYRENANPMCPDPRIGTEGCGGIGMIRYHLAQDESRVAPCPLCFPNDPWAIEARTEFYRR